MSEPAFPTIHLSICHAARNPRTGVWTAIKELALWQKRHGYEVELFLLRSKSWPYANELKELGLKCDEIVSPELPGTMALVYHYLTRAGNQLSQHISSCTIVHYHDAWMSGALLARNRWSTHPALVTFHGVPEGGIFEGKPLRRWLHRRWARRLRDSQCVLVSVDRRGANQAWTTFRIPTSRFTVVPNGIRDPAVRGCPKLRDSSLLTVGFIGGLGERKGWRIVADAVQLAKNEGAHVRFLIAGPAAPEEAAAAVEICSRIGAGSNYLGLVPNAPTTVMPQFDVLVLPSNREGMPMAIIEALSLGIPVIATRVGGIPDMIRDEVEGFLVERNAKAIAKKLTILVNSDRVLASMSNSARKRFLACFQIDVMGRAYERLYLRCASGCF